jgi:hypothetical protein
VLEFGMVVQLALDTFVDVSWIPGPKLYGHLCKDIQCQISTGKLTSHNLITLRFIGARNNTFSFVFVSRAS